MNIRIVSAALTALGLWVLAASASGQILDGTSTGSRGLGSSMFSNRQQLGSTLTPGRSSLFGSPGGTPGSGLGTGQAGQGGFGQDPGFVGRNSRTPGDAGGGAGQDGRRFVGAAQAGGGAGRTGLEFAGPDSLGDGANLRPRRTTSPGLAAGQFAGQLGGQFARRIPTKMRVAFDVPSRGAEGVSTPLARRLAGAPAIHSLAPIQVELQGRTAILRGQVASEHDRDLAEQVARLEPGIETVRNELAVAGPNPAPPPPATPGPASSPR